MFALKRRLYARRDTPLRPPVSRRIAGRGTVEPVGGSALVRSRGVECGSSLAGHCEASCSGLAPEALETRTAGREPACAHLDFRELEASLERQPVMAGARGFLDNRLQLRDRIGRGSRFFHAGGRGPNGQPDPVGLARQRRRLLDRVASLADLHPRQVCPRERVVGARLGTGILFLQKAIERFPRVVLGFDRLSGFDGQLGARQEHQDLKAEATTFDDLGAFADALVSLDGPDGSERAVAYRTTAGLLDQTHVPPLIGRLFTPAEDTPGASDVVVLSHGMWQRRFGADPGIVGRVLRLTGVPYTVIGVMPRGFLLPPIFGVRLVGPDVVIKEADLWVPFKLDSLPRRRDARALFVLGRLKLGRTLEENQAEVSSIARRLASDYALDDFGMDFTVVPLEQQVLTNVRTLLVLLSFVGALVLVIAATNAAHLLLADSLTMTGETAVRSALGASTWRLASGQGTLSMVWCALATLGALLVAAAIQAPVAAYTKANVPCAKRRPPSDSRSPPARGGRGSSNGAWRRSCTVSHRPIGS